MCLAYSFNNRTRRILSLSRRQIHPKYRRHFWLELRGKGNCCSCATATSHHDRYLFSLAEVFTLQMSSDHSLEVLPLVSSGLFPLCTGQWKLETIVIFPKSVNWWELCRSHFSVRVEVCARLDGLLHVSSAELSYCCHKTCLWQAWTAWAKSWMSCGKT